MKRVLFFVLMLSAVFASTADVIEPSARIYLFSEDEPDAWTVYLRGGDQTPIEPITRAED